MGLQKICVFFFLGIVMIINLHTANAALVKNLEFNVNGVLPSADSDIDFYNNTSSSEASLYSVSGGLLMQRTFNVNGNASYHWPDSSGSPSGTLDSTLGVTMEARLQVTAINGSAGAYFQAFDGTSRYQVSFQTGSVSLLSSSGLVSHSLDITQFHTYRMETPGNSDIMNLFVNDILVLSGTAPVHTLNTFGWGDGITAPGNGADANWDFLRVSQNSVPEPSIIALLGIVLAGLVGVETRRKWEKKEIDKSKPGFPC